MPNNDYWIKRMQDEQERLYKRSVKDVQNRLGNYYRQALRDVESDIERLYNQLMKESADGKVKINDLYKYNRYFELRNQLILKCNELGQNENRVFEEKFTDFYLKINNKTNDFLLDIGIITPESISGSAFLLEQRRGVEKVLSSIWCADGKHWSDRIWRDTSDLQNRLEKGIVDSITRGLSKDELVKQLMYDFQVEFHKADRIARTELTHVQNQSCSDRYKSAGIKKYQILAEIDNRTSEECKEQNGKIYNFEDAVVGVNMPPLHVNCRSTIIPIIE